MALRIFGGNMIALISPAEKMLSMNRPNYRLLVTVLLILLPLMAMATTPPSIQTGLEGVISVSPSRPGPQRIDAPNIAPAPNVAFVVKRGETTVTSFTTDAEGRFRIRLDPGHYTVSREDPGAAIGHWRFEVDVVANEVTKVHWTGDSGMR